MRTLTTCGGCGCEVVSAELDPLNENPKAAKAAMCKTFIKDVDGEDVALCWHAECLERDKQRRGVSALPEPSTVDWESEIRAVLEAAEGS
jgi:hypothetical protein